MVCSVCVYLFVYSLFSPVWICTILQMSIDHIDIGYAFHDVLMQKHLLLCLLLKEYSIVATALFYDTHTQKQQQQQQQRQNKTKTKTFSKFQLISTLRLKVVHYM